MVHKYRAFALAASVALLGTGACGGGGSSGGSGAAAGAAGSAGSSAGSAGVGGGSGGTAGTGGAGGAPPSPYDPTFGDAGCVVLDVGGYDFASRVARQSDERVLVAGHTTSMVYVLRLDASGVLDASFGDAGIAKLANLPSSENTPDGTAQIGLLKDGRMIVAAAEQATVYVTKLEPSGSVDPAFGTSGTVTLPSSLMPVDLLVDVDDSIFLVGSLAVAKLDATGALVASFGSGGVATLFPIPEAKANAATIQPDGKLVVAGYKGETGANSFDTVIVRLAADGTPDTSFAAGMVVNPFASNERDAAEAVVIDAGGNVVIAGTARHPNVANTQTWFVSRFQPGGQLDASFGTDGWTLGPTSNLLNGDALALAPSGELHVLVNGQTNCSLATVLADGAPGSGAYLSGNPWRTNCSDMFLDGQGRAVIGGDKYDDANLTNLDTRVCRANAITAMGN